jgi:hypothetical protein
MRTAKRLEAIERRHNEVLNEMLESMSDEELERLAGQTHPAVDQWMNRLTNAELEALCRGKPGLSAILATAPKEFFERGSIA